MPLLLVPQSLFAAEQTRTIVLENFDQLNMQVSDSGAVWYGRGHISIRLDSTRITSDSMIWYRDHDVIHFYGNVNVRDSIQVILARTISYYHRDSALTARGGVEMIHWRDSVRTESETAEYDRKSEIIYLEGTPRLYLNYPDSANMVEVTGEYLTFSRGDRHAEAVNNVVITYQNTRATCGCAEYLHRSNLLILTDNPFATRDSSTISGQLMEMRFARRGIRQIDVFEKATAFFVEEADSASKEFSGHSTLSGETIRFDFKDEEIRKITAAGEARSEYLPSPDDTTGAGKNFVSGDTIFIYVDHRKIAKVEIKGGAEGVYIADGKNQATTPSDTLTPVVETAAGSSRQTRLESDTTDLGVADSGAVASEDSLTAPDSLSTASASEDSIRYTGRFLEYFAPDRVIRITGDAKVRQGKVELEADRIDYDVPKRVVYAVITPDSADSGRGARPLMLKDENEAIYGSKLIFNVDTKKGKIENATTQYEQAYYRGRDLYKEEEKVFYVSGGKLTSCELAEPHFHFQSSKMKLIHNDRVIARPVTLYIETLPVLAIPYYIFPLKRGRHSGILPIKLGNFEQGSRFIGNLGYYWAASEYWDLQTSLDFYENIGIRLNGQFRYVKRYAYSGYVLGAYARDRQEFATGETKSDKWEIQGSHNQVLPYEIDLRASGQFVSDKGYISNYSIDPTERRNRTIISKANLNKRFGRSSLSASFSHTKNLDTGARSSTVPSGSFTLPSFNPFGSGREVDGKVVKKWYNNLYTGYRNSFSIYSDQNPKTERIQIDDSTEITRSYKTRKEYAYLDHSISFSAGQNVLKYISISPNVSLQETWYYIFPTDQSAVAGIPANRPYRRGAISAGISTNTNLYGTFPIGLLGLNVIRHVMQPSVGFSWSPAVKKNDAVKTYTGRGGGGSKQKSLSFSLQHNFQAKVRSGDSEKKLDLFRVSSGLSYNFEATGRKFSSLNTSISSTLLKNVNLQGNLSHELYDEDDRLRWRSPSLRSFSISSSFQARGSVADNYAGQGLDVGLPPDTLDSGFFPESQVAASPPGATASGWNLNLSHYYTESRQYGKTTSRTHWLQVTFNLDLTSNWKLKYSQKYDFVRHQSIDKTVDLYRRIHCWEGHFYWIPTGSRQGYYFKINVIAIPDIKLEKSESGLRGALLGR